jgi:hypothetical protein
LLTLSQVILGVGSLAVAAERLTAQGLDVVDGGVHPGVGTANRLVALDGQYLELLAIVDPDLAAASEYGRSLARRTAGGDALVRWSLRTDDIDGVAARLGLAVEARSRQRPDGELLTWRAAGLAEALDAGWLPFFMQWDDPAQYPGQGPPGLRVQRLEVAPGDDRFAAWTAGADAPVEVVAGPPGLRRVTIVTPPGARIAVP